MVEYKYNFEGDYWFTTDTIFTFIHNSLFDSPIPEEVVLEVARKEFGNKYTQIYILRGALNSTNYKSIPPPQNILALTEAGMLNVLYDFKTEKFLVKPNTIKPKMTLEQKKTLIKMIHEI